MRKKIPEIVILLLFMPVLCQATTIEFYTDGTIEDGDIYTGVDVYDNAVVDMTGGLIEACLWLWDTSTVNIYGGMLGDYGDIILSDFSSLHLHHLDVTEWHRIWTEGDNAKIHVYGYGFEYVQYYSNWLLSGYWADESMFTLYLRGPFTRPNTVLHVIPEPATFLLVGLGGLVLRKKK